MGHNNFSFYFLHFDFKEYGAQRSVTVMACLLKNEPTSPSTFLV